MNKYYTPKINEFCIGFEYEEFNDYRKEWSSDTWTEEDFEDSAIVYQLFEAYYGDRLRVKYLDRSDIEELGFRYITSEHGQDMYVIDGTNVSLFKYENNINIRNGGSRFNGKIKNKSELRKVLEMIGVIRDV